MSAAAFEIRTPDGALLATAGNLTDARRATLEHPGRACVVHAGAVVDWARGIGPSDRVAAEALLRRLGIVTTAAPARLTSCDRCGKTLPARAESPTCDGCRRRAAARAAAAPKETQSAAPEEPVPAAKPAVVEPKATQSPAPKAAVCSVEGCDEPQRSFRGTLPEGLRPFCKRHRQREQEKRCERRARGLSDPYAAEATSPPAPRAVNASKPAPVAKPPAPSAAALPVDRAPAPTPDVTLRELLEAHALVAAIGLPVVRAMAAALKDGR